MRHHVPLGVLLPAIAFASTAGGCSGAREGVVVGDELSASIAYELDLCDGDEYRQLEGVTASDPQGQPVEYMELRREYPERSTSLTPEIIAKAGTPCASAEEAQTCKATLAAFRSSEGWWTPDWAPLITHRYLLWTSGDQVAAVTSLEALRDFVGEVDTVKDAALLVTAAGIHRIACDGAKNARATADGWSLRVQSGGGCGANDDVKEQDIAVDRHGETTVTSTKILAKADPKCAVGRRPAGLANHDGGDDGNPVGRFFAEVAHLEAASVVAFERLADELATLGAPADLVASALASRDDEIRHARMTAKAAARRGGRPVAPVIHPAAERTMLDIALENAVEGCVRETYGALVAHHQARAASDPAIASMMRVIAEDETRHAGLAWDVAAWLEPQLSAEERAAVAEARSRALAELRSALENEPDGALVSTAGVPIAPRALEMLDVLTARFVEPAAAAIG